MIYKSRDVSGPPPTIVDHSQKMQNKVRKEANIISGKHCQSIENPWAWC